ncbi:MAG TPA: DUF418 domain-containing protein [Candidatus Acidoferrum sp.]|nr:DUF418 domain-containing protein [Candidatus Acidoferrum sp.]
MQPVARSVGPVSLTERIQFIDVLRGMALFGILAANMRAFVAPLDTYDNIHVLFHSRADVAAQFLIDFLFQGKFISIFSFLFGMGFAIQLSRAEARGVKFLSFYPRRLLALAIFGIIHGILIWAGDILLTYAITGAILLLFRNKQQKTLLWWAGGLFSIPIVVGSTFLTLYYTRFRPHFMNPKPADMTKIYAIIQIYAHGTVHQILKQNWVEWKGFLVAQLFSIYAVGLFLLGMWVWRSGIVQRLPEYRPVFKRVCAWCVPIGLVFNFFGAYENAVVPDGKFTLALAVSSMVHFLGAHILAAGYISGLALIFLNVNLRRFIAPFAAVGRIALTDYLMQSVLCTLFFYHYTTGLFGRVGPAMALIPTVVLYSAQVVFSNWWLRHYRFGPMEWLWRGLTYGKFPSMRKGEAESVIDALPGDTASPLPASTTSE